VAAVILSRLRIKSVTAATKRLCPTQRLRTWDVNLLAAQARKYNMI
jgi:hypothetical protein